MIIQVVFDKNDVKNWIGLSLNSFEAMYAWVPKNIQSYFFIENDECEKVFEIIVKDDVLYLVNGTTCRLKIEGDVFTEDDYNKICEWCV